MKEKFVFFPNPFVSKTVIMSPIELKNTQLKVYDMMGREIKKIKNMSGKEIIVKRDDMTNGIYFYKITQYNIVITTGKLIFE